MDDTALAFIALGSNLGDSATLVAEAMERLRSFSDRALLTSSLWRTAPIDCPPGSASFINAVAALHPRLDETPESLLAKLQGLEREFGRQPKVVPNEPRPLDLDLIGFGELTRATPRLVLPHPRARWRRFVLQPLAEIAPDLVLPGWGATAGELLGTLGSEQELTRLPHPRLPDR